MLKAKKNSLIIAITLLITILTLFGIQLKADAVFTNDFNVTWDNSGNTNIGGGSANSMNGSFSKIMINIKQQLHLYLQLEP